MLVPHVKTTITVDSPAEDLERTTSTPGVPLTAVSMRKVISVSTSSGERPGASVWITTCGGANSGRTSRVMFQTTKLPTTRTMTNATTVRRRLRSDHLVIQSNIFSPFLVRMAAQSRSTLTRHERLGVDLLLSIGDDVVTRK